MDDDLVYKRTLEYVLSLSSETGNNNSIEERKDGNESTDVTAVKRRPTHRKNNSLTFMSVKSGKSDESEIFRVIKNHQVSQIALQGFLFPRNLDQFSEFD